MKAPKDNMHCVNPSCIDDNCRGECEQPKKDIIVASQPLEKYCED